MIQIELKELGLQFNETTWGAKDINLEIKKSEFVSFLGPSGCGKTTTLRMIAGLQKNTHGLIKINSKTVNETSSKTYIPPEKRNVGMVFQSYAVWPHMNVFDNVAYPLKIQKKSKDEINSHVTEILKVVELNGLELRSPKELSGGQQQRVALARGLVMKPDVLLLDEPLSNLDAKLREKMRKDIRQIQKDFNLTVVYVTHDQLEANTMSDRIVVMNKGQIEQVGTVDEINKNPVNEFVKEFVRRS